MKVRRIALILALAMAPAVAGDLAPLTVDATVGKIRAKDWQKLKVADPEPRRFIEFTQDVELSCQSEGDSPRKLLIRRNIYPIEQQLHNKKGGQDWLLVPAQSSQSVKFGYNNSAGRTWDYAHLIALDPDSLTVFPGEVVQYTQEWTRLDGSRWPEGNWTFGCIPTLGGMSGQPVVRTATEAEFAAAQEGHMRQMVHDALHEALHRKHVLERDRPLKSQIGASVCRMNDRILMQGFTENRSPDNGKIQIRIWRASFSDSGRPGPMIPSGFHESVIWDDPDNWDLCDS
jgi:hypothetical protein